MWQGYFVTPATARLPAIAMQEVGRCTQRIGDRIPDVTLAIAIHIDGIGLIARRDELCVAERAGPGTGKMAAVNIAGLENLHCSNQLCAAIFGATLVCIGKRCQRTDGIAHNVITLENFAVIAFHRPDGEQDIAIDRETLFDALEPRTPFARHVLAD